MILLGRTVTLSIFIIVSCLTHPIICERDTQQRRSKTNDRLRRRRRNSATITHKVNKVVDNVNVQDFTASYQKFIDHVEEVGYAISSEVMSVKRTKSSKAPSSSSKEPSTSSKSPRTISVAKTSKKQSKCNKSTSPKTGKGKGKGKGTIHNVDSSMGKGKGKGVKSSSRQDYDDDCNEDEQAPSSVPSMTPTMALSSMPSMEPSISSSPSAYDCESPAGRLRDAKTIPQLISGPIAENTPQSLAREWLINVDTYNACDGVAMMVR